MRARNDTAGDTPRFDGGPAQEAGTGLGRLRDAIDDLRIRAVALEHDMHSHIARVDPRLRDSARNLLHYLAVRRQDIRGLQEELAALGLSSLGRMEAHTVATLNAVSRTLHRLAGGCDPGETPAVDFATGPLLLERHTRALLGNEPAVRKVRIMVTMPTEAATDPMVVRDLVASGMNVMRINCAHDGPEQWLGMIENLRAATRKAAQPCRILADLAGPKLRTGDIVDGPGVVKIKPRRDVRGRVIARGLSWLTAADRPAPSPVPGAAVMTLPASVLAVLSPGDRIALIDARGRRRRLDVTQQRPEGVVAATDRTVYVENGIALVVLRGGEPIASCPVGGIPPTPGFIRLAEGDLLHVTANQRHGAPAWRDPMGNVVAPASIGCTLPEVFNGARVGDPVYFDDGRIGGRIEHAAPDRLEVRINLTPPGGAKLRAQKGINLPLSRVDVPAIGDDDIHALEILAPHIDMVGLSFVRTPADVETLQAQLARLGAGHTGIVLKIENRVAFEHLPRLLLTAMRSPVVGVMLARGDLAVEVGYERLSEVQEEILWLCEAAHVPVIWATQVLEDLANKGIPSRSEVTDAAMSGRAECVMLNKGPHVVRAVEMLSAILDRMEEHQSKKSSRMRRLSIAGSI